MFAPAWALVVAAAVVVGFAGLSAAEVSMLDTDGSGFHLTRDLAAVPSVCNATTPAAFCTDLPIIKINTFGVVLNKTWPPPKTPADVSIIDNGPGRLNYFNDSGNEYDGAARIWIRGQTSRENAKVSYSLDTVDSAGEKNKVSVLGMPEGWKWVLYTPWGDKSLVRNAVIYNMSASEGWYCTRTQFVEVFLNSNSSVGWDYIGVYVFEEKIRRGKDRVDVAKLTPEDNTEPDISGGYILKIDKLRAGEEAFFFDLPSATRIIGYYPDVDDITEPQKAWITTWMTAFETALNQTDFYAAVTPYINATSFMDYFFIQELTRNVDGFHWSTYMYKERSGKLFMGPIWDMDIGFGNANYDSGWVPYGWQFELHTTPQIPFWWARLMESPVFVAALNARWEAFRQTIFSEKNIFELIDAKVAIVGAAEARNFERWPILSSYEWPQPPPFYPTYAPYVAFMKTWISARLGWLDTNMPLLGQAQAVSIVAS